MLDHYKTHLQEASFGYQANAAMIQHAKDSWDNDILIIYPSGKKPQITPGSIIHITIDWDKDRNELQRQHKRYYNKEKPQFVSLNIKIEPATEQGYFLYVTYCLLIIRYMFKDSYTFFVYVLCMFRI